MNVEIVMQMFWIVFDKRNFFQQLRYEGFIVTRWLPRWMEGIGQMAQWIKEGKVKTEETVLDGFEKMPEAFQGLFKGSNVGKMIVKI